MTDGFFHASPVRQKSGAGKLHIESSGGGITALCGRVIVGYERPPFLDKETGGVRNRTVADVIATRSLHQLCRPCRERAGL